MPQTDPDLHLSDPKKWKKGVERTPSPPSDLGSFLGRSNPSETDLTRKEDRAYSVSAERSQQSELSISIYWQVQRRPSVLSIRTVHSPSLVTTRKRDSSVLELSSSVLFRGNYTGGQVHRCTVNRDFAIPIKIVRTLHASAPCHAALPVPRSKVHWSAYRPVDPARAIGHDHTFERMRIASSRDSRLSICAARHHSVAPSVRAIYLLSVRAILCTLFQAIICYPSEQIYTVHPRYYL